eukprot:TRINITY_DN1715_c0_g1_i1.p1 TRINITY_DN1715_c0_g1~~TRINITY_DN1715_c0_g1_i1.p1  ORF type:complete len:284 (-),score=56.57 TRINITY_DN1715_c0_g1_i1:120-971(-)
MLRSLVGSEMCIRDSFKIDEKLYPLSPGTMEVKATTNTKDYSSCTIFEPIDQDVRVVELYNSTSIMALLIVSVIITSASSILFDRFTPERWTRYFVLLLSESVASYLIMVLRIIYASPKGDCFVNRYHYQLFLRFTHQGIQVLLTVVLFFSAVVLGGMFFHKARIGLYFRNAVGAKSLIWKICLGFSKVLLYLFAMISIAFPLYKLLVGSVMVRGMIYFNFDLTAFTIVYSIFDLLILSSSGIIKILKRRPRLSEEKSYEEKSYQEMEISERQRSSSENVESN